MIYSRTDTHIESERTPITAYCPSFERSRQAFMLVRRGGFRAYIGVNETGGLPTLWNLLLYTETPGPLLASLDAPLDDLKILEASAEQQNPLSSSESG